MLCLFLCSSSDINIILSDTYERKRNGERERKRETGIKRLNYICSIFLYLLFALRFFVFLPYIILYNILYKKFAEYNMIPFHAKYVYLDFYINRKYAGISVYHFLLFVRCVITTCYYVLIIVMLICFRDTLVKIRSTTVRGERSIFSHRQFPGSWIRAATVVLVWVPLFFFISSNLLRELHRLQAIDEEHCRWTVKINPGYNFSYS